MCCKNIKYINTLRKIDNNLKLHKHNVTLKMYVFKEDQLYQSFLHCTILQRNSSRNFLNLFQNVFSIDASRIFNTKSLLVSLDKALMQHSHYSIILGKISVMQENEIYHDSFLLVTALWEHNHYVFF